MSRMRWAAVAACLLVFILMLSGARPVANAAPPSPVPGPQINLSLTPYNSGNAKVAVSGQHVYTVWADRSHGTMLETYFRHSDNGGASFASTLNLSRTPSQDSNVPAIAVSGDNVYVVWEEHMPPYGAREVMLAVSRDNGRAFSAPVAISQTAGDSTRPGIAVAGQYVWVIWSELDGERVGLNLARSKDDGNTFATDHLSPNARTWAADVAASGKSGYVITPLKDPATGAWSVRLMAGAYDDAGNYATTPNTLMENVTESTAVEVAASDHAVYAFWRVQRPGDDLPSERFYFTRSLDRGATFPEPTDFTLGSPTGIRSGYPAPIALAADGARVHLAWLEVEDPWDTPRTGTLYAASLNSYGSTTNAAASLDTLSGANAGILTLDISASGAAAHVVWDHEGQNGVDVWGASTTDGGFSYSDKVNISSNPGESGGAAVAAAGTGFHVAWMDYTPGNWEVLYRQVNAEIADLEVTSVAIIQAPMVTAIMADGKPTKVRVTVFNGYGETKQTQAKVKWEDAAGTITFEEYVTLVPGPNILYLPQLPMAGKKFLRPAAGVDPAKVTVTLNPLAGETNTDNNTASAAQKVVQTRPLSVVYRPLATPFEAYPSCAELTRFANTSQRLIEATYPIDEREARMQIDCIPLVVPSDIVETYTAADGTQDQTIKDVVFEALSLGRWVGNVDKVVGVTRPNWLIDRIGGAVGLAPWPGTSSIVDSQMTSGAITAHEMAHNFGWVKPGTEGASGSHLEMVPADGYWVVRDQVMADRVDFMNSYAVDSAGATVADKAWISLATYAYLRDELAKPFSDPAVVGVRGTVYSAGSANLSTWYRLEGNIDLPLDNPGEYRLRYLDADGNTLAETGFDLSFAAPPDAGVGELDHASFAYRIPEVAGTRAIALLHGETELGRREFSANAPTVAVTYPNGGEDLLIGDEVTATWTAADDDGDSLRYVVALSADDGNTWIPLATDLAATEFTFEIPENLLSDQVLFKVMASDGVNTTEDVSDATFAFRRNLNTAGCFGPAVNLAEQLSGESEDMHLATADGYAYVVWAEGVRVENPPSTTIDLFFQVSADGGQTWGEPQRLYDSGYIRTLSPKIAAAGSSVYITFAKPAGSYSDPVLLVSHNHGQTFEEINFHQGMDAFQALHQPFVADGRVYILMSSGYSALAAAYLLTAPLGSSTFSSRVPVFSGYKDFSNLTLTAGGDDVYVAYHDKGANNSLILRYSSNGGASFDYYDRAKLAENVMEQFSSASLVANGNDLYVVLSEESRYSDGNNKVSFLVSRDKGANFSDKIDLDEHTGIMRDAQLVREGTNLHVLWPKQEDPSKSHYNIYYAVSHDDGATFSAPLNLSQTTEYASQQSLLAFGDKVYVTWREDTIDTTTYPPYENMGDIIVRASADGGDSFFPAKNISGSAGIRSVWPRLALSGETVLLAWLEAGATAYADVHLARSVACSGGDGGFSLTPEPPVLPEIDSPSVAEGERLEIEIAAGDANEDAIVYSAANLPPFAIFEDRGDNTAVLVLAPGYGQAATYPDVTITASDGALSVERTFTVIVPASNRPPSARAGGPYAVFEGDSLMLDGSASIDPDGQALTYTWEFGGQDYNTATVHLSTGDDYVGRATLRVRDSGGAEQTATADVAVINLPPKATAALAGTRLVTFTDPGVDDTHTATIDWGDGTPVVAGTVRQGAGSGSVEGSHAYAAPGTYTVTVTVRDDDGGEDTVTLPYVVTESPQYRVYVPLVRRDAY